MKTLRLFFVVLFVPAVCWAVGDCSMISQDVTLTFGVETETPDSNQIYTLDIFHTDVEVSFTAQGWDIEYSYDHTEGALDIDPAQSILYVNENATWNLTSVPSGFEFIGFTPNEDFWILPQSSQSGVLHLGFAAQESDSANLCDWDPNDPSRVSSADKWYKIELVDVRGPEDSDFSVWQTNPLNVYMSTEDGGITEDDVYYMEDGLHDHMNWGFTKQGFYEVDLKVTTVYTCDESLTADTALQVEGYYSDCVVDIYDLAVISEDWLKTGCQDPNNCVGGDISDPNDGIVDYDDLTIMADQWLECGYPGCDND